jgi:hypothetical protein
MGRTQALIQLAVEREFSTNLALRGKNEWIATSSFLFAIMT